MAKSFSQGQGVQPGRQAGPASLPWWNLEACQLAVLGGMEDGMLFKGEKEDQCLQQGGELGLFKQMIMIIIKLPSEDMSKQLLPF